MFGVVLAAGLGTRLAPLTDRLPKPALPVLNRPLASYALARLAALGVRSVALNAHHLPDALEQALEGHAPDGMSVRFAREPELLGTGGGVRNAARALAADDLVIVMNGDILFWPDLEGALALHRSLDAIATVVLREDPRARELGPLGIDPEGRVRTLLGMPVGVSAREHMFTGVHVLSVRALAELPERGCIIRTAYRRWIDEGEIVGGFVDASPWRDLGTPREYLRANLDLVTGRLRWPGVEAPGVLIGEGARVDGELEECVIGPRAIVEPGVRVARSVVWADTRVSEGADGAIVAGDLRMVP